MDDEVQGAGLRVGSAGQVEELAMPAYVADD
jgi:hypothetical protein